MIISRPMRLALGVEHLFVRWINSLRDRGVTPWYRGTSCSDDGSKFCPDSMPLRGPAAWFVIQGILGLCKVTPGVPQG